MPKPPPPPLPAAVERAMQAFEANVASCQVLHDKAKEGTPKAMRAKANKALRNRDAAAETTRRLIIACTQLARLPQWADDHEDGGIRRSAKKLLQGVQSLPLDGIEQRLADIHEAHIARTTGGGRPDIESAPQVGRLRVSRFRDPQTFHRVGLTLNHCYGSSDGGYQRSYTERLLNGKSEFYLFSHAESGDPLHVLELDAETRGVLEFRGQSNADHDLTEEELANAFELLGVRDTEGPRSGDVLASYRAAPTQAATPAQAAAMRVFSAIAASAPTRPQNALWRRQATAGPASGRATENEDELIGELQDQAPARRQAFNPTALGF